MKKWIIGLFSGMALLITLAGCTRGGGEIDNGNGNGNGGNGPHIFNPADTIAPVVEIHTPTPNQVYASGSTINITGKVSDGEGLYKGNIRITNDASGALVKEQLYEIHGVVQYNFNISHTASVTAAADYTVTVSFEDHGQNITSRSVKIKVNP